MIGHNTIIESNVVLGSNCIIGNNILIKNSIIGNDVRILDGSVIGKKGFGFLPNQNKNVRYPHIGMVIIEDNVALAVIIQLIVVLSQIIILAKILF